MACWFTKNKNIDWAITGWLTLGSVPAVALTLWFPSTLQTSPEAMNAVIKQALGFVLFATALAIFFKKRLLDFAHKRAGGHYNPSGNRLNALTVINGLVLGTMVALTSISALAPWAPSRCSFSIRCYLPAAWWARKSRTPYR